MAYDPNGGGGVLTDGTDIGDITADGEVKVVDDNVAAKLDEIDTNTTGLGLEATQLAIKSALESVISSARLKTDGSAVTQPVSITTLPSGTNTIGGVIDKPTTSGGLSTHSKRSGATNTVETVKGSAGQIYSYQFYNNSAAARTVMLYDTAGTVTVGTTVPFDYIALPAGGGAVATIQQGQEFTSGIKYVVTSDMTGYTGGTVSTGDVTSSIKYK